MVPYIFLEFIGKGIVVFDLFGVEVNPFGSDGIYTFVRVIVLVFGPETLEIVFVINDDVWSSEVLGFGELAHVGLALAHLHAISISIEETILLNKSAINTNKLS